jgi:membrane associated rhomboid family serine protease
MVRKLILINGGVYLAQLFMPLLIEVPLRYPFGLDTAHPLHLWRYFTYLFIHGGPFHLLFNMFALWIFGSDMEDYFGGRRFLQYYFFTGVGAGVCVMLIDLLTGQRSLVIGASGAVFGLLLAFGIVYAERVITLLLFFVLPVTMKARHFVIIFGVIEFFFGVSGASRVAHFAHLGGMACGFFFLKAPAGFFQARGPGIVQTLRERFRSLRSERDDRRMDDLLRKVNEEGIQSLTDEEKQFLHRMSRTKKWQ